MEKWTVSAKRADFYGIADKFGISPITARLIRNRDVVGDENIKRFLYGGKKDLYSPHLMKDLDKAVRLLLQKIRDRKRIRIIGDYDVDGIMSTYILYDALKKAGADVDYRIPDRIIDGYGLNTRLISDAKEEGCDTVLTCDNGISAEEAVRLAKDLGMTVIVTDHHEIPFEMTGDEKKYVLPPADAVVDPKREDCGYPCKLLCGAAVAWKLITALYDLMGEGKESAEQYLMFAAFATVADVCDLVDENRIIVKEGLKMLSLTTHTGMSALIRETGTNPSEIGVYTIGFVLGPCINAAGRLKNALVAMKLMTAEYKDEAEKTAQYLRELNETRKNMTLEGFEDAVRQIEEEGLWDERVLVVYLSECHESLAGIIAGRIKEKYMRPAYVLTDTADGLKGSGRSIEGYSMYEELTKVKELLTKFGGHPMAAGISLKKENLPAFRRRLNELCTLTEDDLTEKIRIDMKLPFSHVSEKLVEEIGLIGPFGTGNSRPLFAQSEVKVLRPSVVGAKRNAVRMTLTDASGLFFSAVYFGDADAFLKRLSENGSLSVTYYPEVNVFRGRRELQLKIANFM